VTNFAVASESEAFVEGLCNELEGRFEFDDISTEEVASVLITIELLRQIVYFVCQKSQLEQILK
jgi:hypothetical protein